MEQIFGLPAHPLMVHFSVVAIPLLSLLAIAVVVRPSLRPKWRHALAAFAILTVASTILTAGSGEALADAFEAGEYIDKHRRLGEVLRIMVIGLGVLLLALLYLSKPHAVDSTAKGINSVANIAVLVLSVLALIWVARTGHEGSTVVWEGRISEPALSVAATSTTEVPSTTTGPSTTTASSTTEPSPAFSETSSTSSRLPATTGTGTAVVDLAAGQMNFEANCVRCHGEDGSGVRGRPSLIDIADKYPDTVVETEQIINGGGGMKAFGAILSDEEIANVIAYYRAAFRTIE